jgi:hypothetical protein
MKIDKHLDRYMNFDEGEIGLIIERRNGDVFRNQVNGTACSHFEIIGDYINFGYSDHNYFNPSWWYKNCYREKNGERGFINGWVFKDFFENDEPDFDSEEYMEKLDQEIEQETQDIITHPNFNTWSEFIPKFEEVLNKVNRTVYKNFKVLNMFEAWVKVEFEDINGQKYSGVISWNNCD